MAGNAALGAARKIRKRLLDIAADALEAHVDDLVLKDRAVYVKGSPASQLPIAKVLRNSHFTHGGQMMMADYFYDRPTRIWAAIFAAICPPPIPAAPMEYA